MEAFSIVLDLVRFEISGKNVMAKKKKIKKAEKILKEEFFDKKTPEDLLFDEINKAAEGLIYISETDAEILPFSGKKAAEVSAEEIMRQTESSPDSNIEERDFEEFFGRLIKIQDWFGEEETINAGKFAALKDLLERNLRDLKVFKIGSIELNVYVVGLDSENVLKGFKTKAVET